MVGVGSVEDEEVKSKQASSRRKKTVRHGDGDDSTDVGTVCVECFRFLKALAKDYVEAQQRYTVLGLFVE